MYIVLFFLSSTKDDDRQCMGSSPHAPFTFSLSHSSVKSLRLLSSILTPYAAHKNSLLFGKLLQVLAGIIIAQITCLFIIILRFLDIGKPP